MLSKHAKGINYVGVNKRQHDAHFKINYIGFYFECICGQTLHDMSANQQAKM